MLVSKSLSYTNDRALIYFNVSNEGTEIVLDLTTTAQKDKKKKESPVKLWSGLSCYLI